MRVLSRYFVLVFILLSSCKPHISLSGATIPPEAKTVSVGFFANNTTLGAPSLSQRFTEKLRDVVSQQTSLALVRTGGDLQFEGFIQDYQVSPLAASGSDNAAMNRLTITVSVKYSNPFDKSKSFDQTFSAFSDFASTKNLATEEPVLVQEIYRQLTENIFNKAFNNW
ncbi:MAG: LptE family protein [Bacteroidia bacterium]|nr:LptE family protein [Bacteroidia bacterium]